jgi:hypothetical protein
MNPACPADQRQRRATAPDRHRSAHGPDRDLEEPVDGAVAVLLLQVLGSSKCSGWHWEIPARVPMIAGSRTALISAGAQRWRA